MHPAVTRRPRRAEALGLLLMAGLVLAPLASLTQPARPAAPADILPIYPVADAYVYEGAPVSKYGLDQWVSADQIGGQEGYALVRFDLDDLPTGSAVVSATLRLYLDKASGAPSVDLTVSRVSAGWVEADVTWNTRPADTGSYAVTTVGTTLGYYSFDVTTLVKEWDIGTPPNYGFAIRGPDGVAYERRFFSREGDFQPELVVNYDGPTLTPTNTGTATQTGTPTHTPTSTPTRTPTRTPTPTNTFPPTNTPNPAAPELVRATGDLTGMRVINTVDEKLLYWAEAPTDDFCTQHGVIKRMNLLSLQVQTLYTATTCSSLRHLQYSGDRLYFAEGNLVRFVNRHTGGAATTFATAATSVDALAVNRYGVVIYADPTGIYRKGSPFGTVSPMAPGARVSSGDMTVDATYIYWLDPVAHRLERMDFLGGGRGTLVSGLGIATALAIPYFYEDGTSSALPGFVFYANNGGAYAVRPDTGSVHTVAPPASPFNVSGMASDSSSVFWTDSAQNGGSVLRANAGGGPREPIAINRFGASLVQAVRGYVYWAQAGGIYRLPTTATAFADLSLTGLEITQGVQDLANSVPLVAGKVTYVRVHPTSTLNLNNVQVLLYGEQAGVPLPGSPLTPISGTMNLQRDRITRAEFSQSFNFVLPAAWETTNVTLRAVINPHEAIPETNYANNTLSVTRSFTRKSAICFKFLPIHSDDLRLYHTGMPGFRPILDRFRSVWPVPEVRWFTSATILGKPFGHYFHVVDDGDYIIFALWEHNFWNGEPDWCVRDGARAHYIAMVHPDTNTTTSTGITKLGLGSYLEPLAWVKMVGTSLSAFGVPDGGLILAHEAAHNYNGDPNLGNNRWMHINCGLPAGGGFNPNWPYVDTMRIANDGPGTGWGFDPYTRAVIEPTEGRDYMSYCTPQWVSAYNWTGIFNVLNTPSASLASAPSVFAPLPAALNSQDLLVVLGTILPNPDDNVIYGYRLAAETLSAKQGDLLARAYAAAQGGNASYVLELLDANNSVLASQPFAPSVAVDGHASAQGGEEPPPSQSYLVSIPYHPNTLAARVLADGQEISRLNVSPNPPTVALTSPANGAVIGGSLNLNWTASDLDGDDLRFNVLYSPDSGVTWLALATGHTATTLSLTNTAEMIAGSQGAGLIRVVASDGVHTAQDTRTGLTVLNHPPQVSILSPAPGQHFQMGGSVLVSGEALDPDEGPLGSDHMQWRLNGEVIDVELLGGSAHDLILADLPPGTHTLALRAVDSGGAQVETQVSFFVVHTRLYLPVVRR